MSRAAHGPLLALCLAASAAIAADSNNAPIAVEITSKSNEGGSTFSRIISGAVQGDTDATAHDLVGDLQKYHWLRVVDRDPEVTVAVTRRSRTETSRNTNKKGEVTVNHKYSASAAVSIGGSRDTVDADVFYSQGPSSSRDDSEHFNQVSRDLAKKIADRITVSLDTLRPNRPQPGFTHKAKYKMLFRGDGLEITAVEPNSPAAAAGLQVKDRIRSIDGEKGTDQMNDKVNSWWTDLPGARYNLEVEQNKQKRIVQLSLLPPAQWGGHAAAAAPRSDPPRAMPAASMSSPSRDSAPAGAHGGGATELAPGMTEAQVVRALGEPQKKVAFGAKHIWTYDGFTVTFVGGKVTDVK